MNNYASLKVAELKALLKDRSLAQSGRKSDLITRLEEADSKVDGTEDNQAAVGPADEEHAAQAADAEQPQQHKENGDLDGADDMPTAANGEENARQVDDVPADASAPEEGAAGTGTAEEAQEVGVLQNDQVKTGSVDAGAAAAVPQEGENISPGNGDMMDAEQGTGQQPAPLDPEPAPADTQPTSGAPPAETHEEDAAPIAKGDEAPPAAPAEGGDKASEQPDESDSLGLDDSDLDQHEAKVTQHICSCDALFASLAVDHVHACFRLQPSARRQDSCPCQRRALIMDACSGITTQCVAHDLLSQWRFFLAVVMTPGSFLA